MKAAIKTSISILALLTLLSPNVLASGAKYSANIPDFKLTPQATIWGFVGDDKLGMAQGMIPVLKNEDHNLFVMAEGAGNIDSAWFLGGGLGYRFLTNNDSRVFGAYVIGDYNTTERSNSFWVINPGLESLGDLWDFRANGYIPVGSKTKVEKEGEFHDIGIYDYVVPDPVNHILYDARYREIDQTAYGLDVEIGRTIPQLHGLEIFGGGYTFGKFDGDQKYIVGADARINLPIDDHCSLELRDSYNNDQHNSFIIGLKIRLGNFNKTEIKRYGIATRLMDPIEHDIPTLNNAAFAISPVVQQITKPDEPRVPWLTHAWFPEAAPGQGSGTSSDPYTYFNQALIESIKSSPFGQGYANLIFTPGIYLLNTATSPLARDASPGRILLPANYSILGFNSTYTRPAQGAERPVFFGGVDIQGIPSLPGANDQGNNFDSIILLNGSGNTKEFGIGAVNADGMNLPKVSFNNVAIGDSTNLAEQYNYAVLFGNYNFVDPTVGDPLDTITLNSIANSTFKGNLNGMTLFADHDIAIGNITGSAFIGIPPDPDAPTGNNYGMLAQVNVAGNVRINSISDSLFFGLSTTLEMDNFTGNVVIGPLTNVTVGTYSDQNNITRRSVNAMNIVGNAVTIGDLNHVDIEGDFGLNVTALDGNINIGNIDNSVFTGDTSDAVTLFAIGGDVQIGSPDSYGITNTRFNYAHSFTGVTFYGMKVDGSSRRIGDNSGDWKTLGDNSFYYYDSVAQAYILDPDYLAHAANF